MDCAAPASFTHTHDIPALHPPFPPSEGIGGGPTERGSLAFSRRTTPLRLPIRIGGQWRIPREIVTTFGICNRFGGGGTNFFSAESHFARPRLVRRPGFGKILDACIDRCVCLSK